MKLLFGFYLKTWKLIFYSENNKEINKNNNKKKYKKYENNEKK